MKHLIFSISIICSINSFTQEANPDLFQTWYLQSVLVGDGSPTYIVSSIDPAIAPTLTIMEDLTFSGIGACNTFNGTLNLPYSDILQTDQFSYSTDDCGIEIHNDFESAYFNFIQLLAGYSISSVDDGLILNINTPIFGNATFQNYYPLISITEFDLNQIEIYPNPTKSNIYLKYSNNPIAKIEIFNSLGQNMKRITHNFETINISDLPNGLYIIKLYTEFGMVNKKFIKE
ncbi:T9SS type A sorting domain-containing protein [Seonamhaeicola sp. MEBiC1930]|uniref:T9SS type A sorting domain-containing protein n=1 Tax=Seonamhaeicola sp. MEBiC01930 TaxID=2976768 RepID=UPI00324EA929